MNDVPTRTQTVVRKPIVLRQIGTETGGLTAAPKSEPVPAHEKKPTITFSTPSSSTVPTVDPQAELNQLREDIVNYRRTLEQWTQAEQEWGNQRRLFQVMTDNVSDLIVLMDRQGHRVWNNPAYNRVLGYETEELAGTYALSEIHPDEQTRATEALNKVAQEGTQHQSEYRVQKKDGGWVQLLTEIIPLHDQNGQVESILMVATDVTEKNRLAEALSLASTEATAMGMIETMARDFDQILTNVIGNLTIAKNLNGPHNAIAVRLNEMERSLQRARDLIEQMFSIAPQAGQSRVPIVVEEAVQEAVQEVLRGTMVRAEYLFPRKLPEIEVDQEAFSHAIRNIITNSVEAMDKGVIRLTAENIPREQFANRHDIPLKPNDYICLRMQDQGHGISEKALPRVFEPYFTTRSGSQGLGLTTALSSIQRMGGTILIDSTPGAGTTVSVFLPTSRSSSAITTTTPVSATGPMPSITPTAPTPTGSASMRTGTGGLSKVQRKRILLMDDEQMILDIVSRMLGHLGYEVTTCTDGSQAIAAFAKAKSQSEPFDVVMMDLVIPNGVGGQDAVHTIKKIDPHAKVVASSGHLDHPVMTDHSKFGFNAVLEKPYKLEKLQQAIETVVNTPA
ncbi:MAG: PAS domain S-box protein [Methylacidiphilales bacterium]|nr:PAS domain S-box protein [Candidatus Methylacidiphilales bacterium]